MYKFRTNNLEPATIGEKGYRQYHGDWWKFNVQSLARQSIVFATCIKPDNTGFIAAFDKDDPKKQLSGKFLLMWVEDNIQLLKQRLTEDGIIVQEDDDV